MKKHYTLSLCLLCALFCGSFFMVNAAHAQKNDPACSYDWFDQSRMTAHNEIKSLNNMYAKIADLFNKAGAFKTKVTGKQVENMYKKALQKGTSKSERIFEVISDVYGVSKQRMAKYCAR